MSGFTYFINTQVSGSNSLDRLARSAGQADSAINRLGPDAERAGRRGSAAFDGLKSSVMGLVAGVGIAATTLGSLNTAADMDGFNRSISFTGGKEGTKNIEFLKETIESLHLPMVAAYDGFQVLSGGFMGSKHTADTMRDLFAGMSEGATVLGLKSEKLNNAFVALGQMAGKPVLSMEELKTQLQDAFPPAMAVAARAMGMPMDKFTEMVGKGKIVTEDFLPKFAAELHKTFGPGTESALEGARSKFNEFENSMLSLKMTLGNELMPGAIDLINNFLIPGATWIGQNTDAVFSLAGVMGVWIGLTKTATLWQGLYMAATKASAITQLLFSGSLGRSIAMSAISTLVTGGLTGAVTALNAAFWANPIMWVVGGLATLVIGIRYAWNHFEKFRGAVIGVWEWLKELGTIVYESVIKRFIGMGQILQGIFTFDFDKVSEGIKTLGDHASDVKSAGERLGKAFDSGWNTGIDSFAKDQEAKPNALTSPSYVPPGSPGAPGGDGGLGGKAKASADSITGGGQRNITINIGEMGNDMTINVTNLKEAPDAVRDNILKSLLQVVNGTNQVQLN